ncbi:GNAT family N-acetyltransferase [Variovorax sp. PCZ-1]|nr:GNAT family N-acetyltransferase [Variovorax sp. PCZ-1]
MQFSTRRVDYTKPTDRAALTALLNHYATDPMGGGTPIAPEALERLCDDLSKRPFAFSIIAWAQTPQGEQSAGLANCFEGYSTFKAAPLINIHDIVVHIDWRGQGVAQMLMQAVQQEAQARKACKITLEVLTGNTVAMKSYERFGFAPYALDPKAGTATFMQKWL